MRREEMEPPFWVLLNLDKRDQSFLEWCRTRGRFIATLLERTHSHLAGQGVDAAELAKGAKVVQALKVLEEFYREPAPANTRHPEKG